MSEVKPPVVAGNRELSDAEDLVQRELAAAAEKYAETLPAPQLWAPGEVDELMAKLAPTEQQLQQQVAERIACEEYVKLAKDEQPADLTDPLAHIRELILPDCPKAAFATDEELEILYDQWQAKQEE